jgi:hypothetical protein
MALTYPIPNVATGDLIDAADWNALADSINFLARPPACRVYGAAQSIAHNTDVVVAFNAERYDTANLHDTVTNNSRITVPTAGIYDMGFNGSMVAATDYAAFRAFIRLNGTTALVAKVNGGLGNATFNYELNVTGQYKLAAGDYIEVVVRHINTAAAARNLVLASNVSPEFWARWVGVG